MSTAHQQLTASVQVLVLQKGLYGFSVKTADPERLAELGGVMLPALHVGTAPNMPAGGIEFLSGGDERAQWLYAPGDMLIAKVADSPVTLFLTSVRSAGGEPLDVQVERLDGRGQPATAETGAESPEVGQRTEPTAAPTRDALPGSDPPVRLQILAHISNRGDVVFIDTDWVGRLGHGMSIEGFSVTPLDQVTPDDVEYKGLTGAGFESPWISNGEACGTRGMGIPLVGFAIRLKGEATAVGYSCVYRGYFRSGMISEPATNGELCRSQAPGDPLEGIELRIARG